MIQAKVSDYAITKFKEYLNFVKENSIKITENTGLESLCRICNDDASMKKSLLKLMNEEFSQEECSKRNQVLTDGGFLNKTNADALIKLIFQA